MVEVFPSQIVEYMDSSFSAESFQDGKLLLTDSVIAPLSALLALIDSMPTHLIALDRGDFALFTTNRAFISEPCKKRHVFAVEAAAECHTALVDLMEEMPSARSGISSQNAVTKPRTRKLRTYRS